MSKPRTIADAIELWASSINSTESPASHDVSNFIGEGDAIFHYGHHWPLGIIDRRADGTVRAVYVNSNSCTKQGRGGSTNGVQGDVKRAAIYHARNVPVRLVPMGSDFRSVTTIRCKPKASDPEPPRDWSCEIPTYFFATHPGPEPVNDRTACVCGREEEYEYADEEYLWGFGSNTAAETLAALTGHPVRISTTGTPVMRTMRTGVLKWREPKPWEFTSHPKFLEERNRGNEDKICPSCHAHAFAHRQWYERMHGPSYGRNRSKGWLLYCEMMERYGSEAEWRRERLEEFRRVRDGRKAHAEWVKRNTMPQDYVPNLGTGVLRYVPKLDSDGRPFRKDSEAYFKRQREMERRRRRAEREEEARQRYQRQVDRFARGIRRRRKPSFEQTAAQVAANLAEMRASIDATNERELPDA